MDTEFVRPTEDMILFTVTESNHSRNHVCKKKKTPVVSNGLIDAAAPIIIDGVHVATIYQGQFFFEKPDISYSECQAQCYGFNREAYLAALDKVPGNAIRYAYLG